MGEEPNPHPAAQSSDGTISAGSAAPSNPLRPLLNSVLGVLVSFFVAILANLLAHLIQEEWLNPFALPTVVVVVLLTVAGLVISVWLSRGRPLTAPKVLLIRDRRLARGLTWVAIATIAVTVSAVLVVTFAEVRGCRELRLAYLELYLATPQSYPGNQEIRLEPFEVFSRGNLSGRVVFANQTLADHCECEWWGETDQRARQKLAKTEARTCGFSIALQEGSKEIKLTLNVSEQVAEFKPVKSFDFTIKVQPKAKQ